jgi:hypothetical protein
MRQTPHRSTPPRAPRSHAVVSGRRTPTCVPRPCAAREHSHAGAARESIATYRRRHRHRRPLDLRSLLLDRAPDRGSRVPLDPRIVRRRGDRRPPGVAARATRTAGRSLPPPCSPSRGLTASPAAPRRRGSRIVGVPTSDRASCPPRAVQSIRGCAARESQDVLRCRSRRQSCGARFAAAFERSSTLSDRL